MTMAMRPPRTSFRALFTANRQREALRIVVVGVVAMGYWAALVPLWTLLVAVPLGLYPLVRTGLKDLIHERKIGTEIFVTVATVIAMISGEYVAAAVLMTIILIAEFIADMNTDRARASISALIGSVPVTATVRTGAADRTVPISDLRAGDVVLVRAGEGVPVDGTVIAGEGSANEASITGESVPVDKENGASVLAGTVLESGALDLRTDRVGAETMFARIIALVESAEAQRASSETGRPCGRLADSCRVRLSACRVRRDTRPTHDRDAAHFHVSRRAGPRHAARDDRGHRPCCQERHPHQGGCVPGIAREGQRKAIVDLARQRGLDVPEPTDFEMIRGRGVKGMVNGVLVLLGNEALLQEQGVPLALAARAEEGTSVHLAVDGRFAGTIRLADETRPGAREAIARLKASGVQRIVMLTGDNHATARRVARELAIDDVQAELLPEGKVQAIASLQANGFSVAMVGDGINDAPALARADVGIAMGVRGTQAAIEAADIALMTDDLMKIVAARALARRAYRTIQENLFFGVGVVHVLGITAALMGWIGPIQAALLHLGPDVLVSLNSTKLLRVSIEGTA